ncbi:hypothetical protein L7F22_004252 [Adiantum nelumboides]|nr:hypothetical protein [Adiantum nelumboides]
MSFPEFLAPSSSNHTRPLAPHAWNIPRISHPSLLRDNSPSALHGLVPPFLLESFSSEQAESIHQAYLCHQASFPLLNDGQTPISGPSRAHSGPRNGGQGFGSDSKAPEDFSQEGKPFVILPASQIAKMKKDLEARAVIGLLAGPRPPAKTLKGWIKQQWGSRGVILETIQSLPKNHYLFVFQTPEMAFDIIGMGPWLIRSSPLLMSRWNKHFNPEESAQKHSPVWVKFPNLPLHYHHHLKMIA